MPQLQQLLLSLALKYKAYIAAAGLAGLALYDLTIGDTYNAARNAGLALVAAGLRHETAPAAQS